MTKQLVCFLGLLLAIVGKSVAINQYDISYASRMKYITYTLTGTAPINYTPKVNDKTSGHFGACMRLAINNVSKQFLQLKIEAGTVLYPDDTSFQRMIVTEDFFVEIFPSQKKSEHIVAMCGQPFLYAPHEAVRYKIGEKVEPKVLSVVEVIEEMELQNGFGQELLWIAVDPTYLYKFRNSELKTPSEAFVALTLNRAGLIGAKDMLRHIPFRPDTLNIKITRRDTLHEVYHAYDTLHNNITLIDTVREQTVFDEKAENPTATIEKTFQKFSLQQARDFAEKELTRGFVIGLSLLTIAAAFGGFVIGRVSNQSFADDSKDDDKA